MYVTKSLFEVKIITLDLISDDRGWLAIPFSEIDYDSLGIQFSLVQINQVYSKFKGTIREMY